VRGDTIKLSTFRGKPVLLAFLNVLTDPNSAAASQSRSQIVFLRSMLDQYGEKGVQVLLVDATALEKGVQPSDETLTNFTYDWKLDRVPLLKDTLKPSLAQQYGVPKAPMTFLIRADGVVSQRWEGFATAAQLALALNDLVGTPVFGSPVAILATPTPTVGMACEQTPAQTKFAGLAAARAFSPQIWLVDGGTAWKSGQPTSARWLVISGQQGLHLHVTARSFAGTAITLVDADLAPVPPAEAQALLAGLSAGDGLAMYLAPATLSAPGCYQIEAVVGQPATNSALYQGNAVIAVD